MPGYLDQYGAGVDRRNYILSRIAVAVVSVTVVTVLGWYLLKNHHQEGVVKTFLQAVRSGDLQGAYRDWGCNPSKPCTGYPYNRFLMDWGPAQQGVAPNDDGPPDLSLLHISDSETCNSGVLLTVAVNTKRNELLWVDKSSDAINFAPYPICPHKSPFAIMLHRTIGQLRKPLLK